MFCMRCGQDVPAAAEFCPSCGQSTKLPLVTATEITSYGVAPPPPQPQQVGFPPSGATQANLKGVAGPLLLFCILLTIVWPLWTLIQFALRPGMFRAISALGLVRMLFGIVVGVSLWMESRAALMLLRIYFVIAVALMVWTILASIMAILRYADHFSFALFAGWLTSLLPYALFLVLGIAYFVKSERVRATYGQNLL